VDKPELKIKSEITPSVSSLNNEQGIALILVLVMLVLLSILGFTVLTTSTSELRIVGNNKSMENAFFAADSAIDYAYTNSDIYNFLIPGVNNTWPAAHTGSSSDDNNYNEVTIGGNKAMVKVDYVETGALPAGMGTEVDAGIGSGGGFKANYYSVSVKGSGPNNAQVEVDSYVARVVPK
jgi:Tfp pilus assembly protein PilX